MRPVFFVYMALAATVAGVVGFRNLPGFAEAPGELAAWDIPPTGSTRILDLYHMNGPMNYRGWPYYFAPDPSSRVHRVVTAPSRPVAVALSRPTIREAAIVRPHPVLIAQVHKPVQKTRNPIVATDKTTPDTCWHLLIGDLFCKRNS
jgi:hypothetical protein